MPSELNRSGFAAAAWRWGFYLGTGVSTLVVTPVFYLFLAVSMAQPYPPAAVGAGALYGLTRSATIAGFAARQGRVQREDPSSVAPVGNVRQRLRWPLLVSVVAGTAAHLSGGWSP